MIRRLLFLMTVLFGLSLPVWGQAGVQYIGQSNADVLGVWRPVPGASIRVCQSGSTGVPCSPLANVYSNAALTVALGNPFKSDSKGNYSFYIAPGTVDIIAGGRPYVGRDSRQAGLQ